MLALHLNETVSILIIKVGQSHMTTHNPDSFARLFVVHLTWTCLVFLNISHMVKNKFNHDAHFNIRVYSFLQNDKNAIAVNSLLSILYFRFKVRLS